MHVPTYNEPLIKEPEQGLALGIPPINVNLYHMYAICDLRFKNGGGFKF